MAMRTLLVETGLVELVSISINVSSCKGAQNSGGVEIQARSVLGS